MNTVLYSIFFYSLMFFSKVRAAVLLYFTYSYRFNIIICFLCSRSIYTADWSTIRYKITDLCANGEPIRCVGAILATQSHESHLVAVAVNQKSSHDNRMLFVSPLTDTLVVADLVGCGAKLPITDHRGRSVSAGIAHLLHNSCISRTVHLEIFILVLFLCHQFCITECI